MSGKPQTRSAPLRVVMVVPRYHPIAGGAELQCRTLIRALRNENVAVPFVLTRRFADTHTPSDVVDGVMVLRHGRPGTSRWSEYSFFLATCWYLIRTRRDYDVIHCHAASVIGFLMAATGRITGRPVLLKLATHGDLKGGRSYGKARRSIGDAVKDRLRVVVAKLSFRHAHVVALNQEAEAALRELGAQRVHRAINGVDLASFHPVHVAAKREIRLELGLPADAFLVLFAGRFVYGKGIDILVDAYFDLAQRHPEVARRVHLCLLGSDEFQYQEPDSGESLARLRREFPQAVTAASTVDQAARYMQMADLYVHPSRGEMMPNALLEAIATGLPCVVTDIAPHVYIKERNPEARVETFPATRPDLLAGEIERFYISWTRGEECRSQLSPDFAIAAVAKRYSALYREMLGESS